MAFFTLTLRFIVILPLISNSFFPSNLHLRYFVKIFDSFFSVVMLETCIFKSFVFFRTHTILDRSLGVL